MIANTFYQFLVKLIMNLKSCVWNCFFKGFGLWVDVGLGLSTIRPTVEPLLYDHPQNHIGVVV